MTTSHAHVRSWIRRLAPVLGLLLLAVTFVGGTHHHSDGAHHVCVVCTAGHSPAVAAELTTPAAVPNGPSQSLHAPSARVPRPSRIGIVACRAPPLA
jgi:hypothetical protein